MIKLTDLFLHYTGEDDSTQCQLFCMADSEKFYHKLADKVIDGTPCSPDTKDVCVDGGCRVSSTYICLVQLLENSNST